MYEQQKFVSYNSGCWEVGGLGASIWGGRGCSLHHRVMEGTMCPEAQRKGRNAAEVFLLLGVSSCDVPPSCHLLTSPQAVWSQWFPVLAGL